MSGCGSQGACSEVQHMDDAERPYGATSVVVSALRIGDATEPNDEYMSWSQGICHGPKSS